MASGAEAPLISHRDDGSDDDLHSELSDEDASTEWPTGSPGLFTWLLTLSAGISGLLFGCKYGTLSCPVQLLTS